MDHMAALVVNTGFESPSSSLHGAGDWTEATGDDEAEENLGNSNDGTFLNHKSITRVHFPKFTDTT